MKYAITILVLLALIAGGVYYYMVVTDRGVTDPMAQDMPPEPETDPSRDTSADDDVESGESVDESPVSERGSTSVIGESVKGNELVAYHFGEGEEEILFIAGIHGGYSWNTTALAYELIDWLESNQDSVPNNLTVTVVPVLNPDGLEGATGSVGRFSVNNASRDEAVRVAGRFNANNVDLNRNFDCAWQESGTWRDRTVSGGVAPFSEPESEAIRDYIEQYTPIASVVWYSASGGVYASSCQTGVSSQTNNLMNIFANASGYPAHDSFDYYELSGDFTNWLARLNIPTISVLLSDHFGLEWEKNLSGIRAVLNHYDRS